jgi:hypothetical protein
MTLNCDSYESSNHTCKWGIDGGQMFINIILENSKFRAHKQMTTDQLTYGYMQVLLIYPANRGLLPAYRHDIFINPTSRDGIKSRFPPIFLLKSRIPLKF